MRAVQEHQVRLALISSITIGPDNIARAIYIVVLFKTKLEITPLIPRHLLRKLLPEFNSDECNVFWCNRGWPFMVLAGFGCSPKICWL